MSSGLRARACARALAIGLLAVIALTHAPWAFAQSGADARQNLAATMDSVVNRRDIVIITRQKAAPVVMMSLEDFNSMHETMYLLSSPANAAHLRQALADIEAGKGIPVTLDQLSSL